MPVARALRVLAVSYNNIMMSYLSYGSSKAYAVHRTAPDENYARESTACAILELVPPASARSCLILL